MWKINKIFEKCVSPSIFFKIVNDRSEQAPPRPADSRRVRRKLAVLPCVKGCISACPSLPRQSAAGTPQPGGLIVRKMPYLRAFRWVLHRRGAAGTPRNAGAQARLIIHHVWEIAYILKKCWIIRHLFKKYEKSHTNFISRDSWPGVHVYEKSHTF